MSETDKQIGYHYSAVFEDSFVPIWIENIAPLYQEFSYLRKSGVGDLQAYLKEFPEAVCLLASKIIVMDVNTATVVMYRARTKTELLGNLKQMMSTINQDEFAQALICFWNQDEEFSLETNHRTLDDKPLPLIISARIPRFDSHQLVIPVTATNVTTLREKQDALTRALEEIKTLKGIVPICASCKNIRDDGGHWNNLENYISDNTEAQFTHGICPKCADQLYPRKTETKP